MPALPYHQIVTLLLLHSWKSEGSNPIYAYEDPEVNAKLNMRRVSGTTARDDPPVDVPVGDRESFGNYISTCMNATLEQLKRDKAASKINGSEPWKKFCTYVAGRNLNIEIERQMMEAGVHPQQLLEVREDVWDQGLFSYNASAVGRVVAQSAFGDILVDAHGLVNAEAGPYLDSAVVYNVDRLRKVHGRVQKRVGGLQSDLDAAMKSKCPLHFKTFN